MASNSHSLRYISACIWTCLPDKQLVRRAEGAARSCTAFTTSEPALLDQWEVTMPSMFVVALRHVHFEDFGNLAPGLKRHGYDCPISTRSSQIWWSCSGAIEGRKPVA
jgi:hypothetical protein